MVVGLLWLALPVVLVSAVQIPLHVSSPTRWQTLGPFPLGTREGQLLPPLLPDPRQESFPSSLVKGGYVSWSKVTEDPQGWVAVERREVEWSQMRLSAGWAVLQHQMFYRRTLTVLTTGLHAFDLTAAAEFSIVGRHENPASRRWYSGNVYSYAGPQPHLLDLGEGVYDVTVTYVHDVRIHGEPDKDGVPRSKWKLDIKRVSGETVEVGGIVAPDVINGLLMGELVGVEVINREASSLLAHSVESKDKRFIVSLLNSVDIAPYQTRRLAITVKQLKPVRTNSKVTLMLSLIQDGKRKHISATIPLSHHAGSPPFRSPFVSTFVSNSGTPTYAVYTPPSTSHCSSFALVALHGAGVDPAERDSGWTRSIAQREKEWIVWPLGLTEWGFDWHGGSVQDVLTATDHLVAAEKAWNKAMAFARPCSPPRKLVALGHSNGGQGAWYMVSHYPDLFVGGVPASGYVKIQDYVPYQQSQARHFQDPALTGILISSLSPYDNDVYASNLAGLPILSRHGFLDDNVPVQHSRVMVSTIDAWSRGAINYSEVADANHWFDDVFTAPIVTNFLRDLMETPPAGVSPVTTDISTHGDVLLVFTLTTANPNETGSKRGFRIAELETPGRLARIDVEIYETAAQAIGARLRTKNVRAFSFDSRAGAISPRRAITDFTVDGVESSLSLEHNDVLHWFDGKWTDSRTRRPRRFGPILSILNTRAPFTLIVGTSAQHEHLAGIAQRIAHDVYLYGKIDSRILNDTEVAKRELGKGNVVLIGGAYTNSVTRRLASDWPVPVRFLSLESFAIHDRVFDDSDHGLIFLAPHPVNPSGLVLVLAGNSARGLERATRLFPMRTGVPLPEWAVSTDAYTAGGIEAAGFWAADWSWSERASYL